MSYTKVIITSFHILIPWVTFRGILLLVFNVSYTSQLVDAFTKRGT